MCAPDATLYPVFAALLVVLIGPIHAASFRAVSVLIWALLVGQSLHVADLARAVPNLKAAGARQAMRRVRRVLGRAPLTSLVLTPHLIAIALRLVSDETVTLVLDSTRCLRWEVFTLGVVFHGRVLPVSWSILPYPWPRNRYTPTVVALIEHTLFYWPTSRSLHLVADRGFPSLKLFGCLECWRTRLSLGYTIRLRAGDWVYLADGRHLRLADLMNALAADKWTSWVASYSHRKKASPSAVLVIGYSQPEYPAHQRGPADQARREARAKRRQAHLLSKGQPKAPETDRVWALLTTAPTVVEARRRYGLCFHTEGTYRDLKAWGLEDVAAHETDPQHLTGLIGLAVLGYHIQASIGAVAGCASSTLVQARQRQWSTADRLSVFWRGRQVLHDRAFDWSPWMRATLTDLTHQLAHSRTPATLPCHPHPNQQNKEAA